ncbi:MAG: hypothetical protein RL219_2073 [Actinomycetota bacterium]|jgi:hypothetical protein
MSRKLTLDDIADLRAYERERNDFRSRVIEVKRRRRVAVGTILTMVFENRETVRLQIQEMARVERILSDEGIQTELDIYNSLIPEPGHLCATLFIELTSEDQMREWLPRLVGIERSFSLRLADGTMVRCRPEAQHEAQLTREEVTAAVHYLTWDFTPEQVSAAMAGPMTLVCDHPAYLEEVPLAGETVRELTGDLAA